MSKIGFGSTKKTVTTAKVSRKSNTPMVADNWQARDDLSTIRRAAEIKADGKRFAAAREEARAQVKALDGVIKGK